MKKERSSNIELLRIVAMIMIIIYHIWCHCISVQLSNDTLYFIEPHFYKRLILFDIISPFGQIANALFIIISGYFMVERKNINLSKIAKKLVDQSLYATVVLITISTIVYRLYDLSSISLIDLNFFNDGSWFIGYYFAVMVSGYLFLNKFLNSLNRKKYSNYLVVLFAITQFCYTAGLINGLSGSLLLLTTGIMLYSLGGFIKKYNPFKKMKTLSFVMCILIIFVFIILSNYNLTSTIINTNYLENNNAFAQRILKFENNYFVPIVIAVCIFELFKRMQIPNNKVINYLGGSTLMIYIIHDNVFMYSVWKNIDWINLLSTNYWIFMYNYMILVLALFDAGLVIFILYKYIKKKDKYK